MTQQQLDDRLPRIYHAAITAAHGGARVSIHVGGEVWEALKAMASASDRPIIGAKLFGFDVMRDAAMVPTSVEVRITIPC